MAAPITAYEVRWRIAGSGAAWRTRQYPPSATVITIPGLVRGKQYEGDARSLGSGGLASAWVPVTFTVSDPTRIPLAPTSLTAVPVADGVSLKWTTASPQAADVEYSIERADVEAGPYTEFTRVRAQQYTYPITDGAVRWFRVRAVTFAGIYSTYSNLVSSTGVQVSRGINLLPDQYCYLEQSTLPTLASVVNGTVTRDASVSQFGVASYKFAATGIDNFAYFGIGSGSYNIPITPGKSYIVSAYVRCNLASKPGQFYLKANDTAGHYVGAFTTSATANATERVSAVITPSAGATSVILRVDNDGGAGCNMWIDGLMIEEQIGGRTDPSPFVRGAPGGLSSVASGVRVADNRNLPQIMVASGRAKVPTTITYSAAAGTPATATISVGAFTVLGGDYTVSYNASSVGVSGTGGTNVTYFLYMDDPTHAGGARTLVATTNGNNVYGSSGRIYIGDVTVAFPTSGTSSGSGERTVECVCADMYLAPDLLASEARIGLLLDCLDLPTGHEPFRRRIEGVRFTEAECVELRTEGGAVWRGSVTTPFDLPDGRVAHAPDMLGEAVITDRGQEAVTSVTPVGLRPVARISVGGVSYAAGEDPHHRIYSHNVVKP